jgi:hypothetical protein
MKLVPDLGRTRLVWYLIPVFIPVLIPVSDPTYQTNTGSNPWSVLEPSVRGVRLAGEQEPNEKKNLVHVPSVDGAFLSAGSLWAMSSRSCDLGSKVQNVTCL